MAYAPDLSLLDVGLFDAFQMSDRNSRSGTVAGQL